MLPLWQYTGFVSLGHFQDSTITRKKLWTLRKTLRDPSHSQDKESTILSSCSSNFKVKMIKAVVRFKWLHFCPQIGTRTLNVLIYNILLTNILLWKMSNIQQSGKNFIVNTHILTIYNLLSFDKHTLYNPNPYQGRKCYHHPEKFLPSQSPCLSHPPSTPPEQVFFLTHYFLELHFEQPLHLWCEESILEK